MIKWLLLFLPLLSFCVSCAGATYVLYKPNLSKYFNPISYLCTITVLVYCIFQESIVFYNMMQDNSPYNIVLFHFLTSGSLLVSWGFLIDMFSVTMSMIIFIISLMVFMFAIVYMKKDKRQLSFFAYMNLFVFAMLFLVNSNNLLQTFIGWEGVGFVSYALVNFWYEKKNATNNSIQAFVMNRFGDVFFILAIIFIYNNFVSINYLDILEGMNVYINYQYNIFNYSVSNIDIACILLLIAALTKSAQIFFHTWLPNAMVAPTPVSALLHSATMVTAGVWIVLRMGFLFNASHLVMSAIVLVGGLTALLAATMACVQLDIKKIVAYSTMSQIGYMFIALGSYNFNGAMYHLVTHAFFKSLLFISCGSIIMYCKEQNIKKLGGLYKHLPLTYLAVIVSLLSLCALPPFSGYFSKEFILLGLLDDAHNNIISIIGFFLGSLAAGFTVLYSLRLFFYVFHGKSNNTYPAKNTKINFLFVSMSCLIILTVLSGLSLKSLFINNNVQQTWGSIATLTEVEVVSMLKYLPNIMVVLGCITYYMLYIHNKGNIKVVRVLFGSLYNLVCSKYYIDIIYANIFKRLFHYICYLISILDKFILQFLFNKLILNSFLVVSNRAYYSYRISILYSFSLLVILILIFILLNIGKI